MPRLVLWAWERPEDLRFAGADTGVGFLAGTIRLKGGEFDFLPRRQPLRVRPATTLVAVVRIETEPGSALSREQMDKAVKTILEAALAPQVRAIQIDFDATVSERAFYRRLLRELRERLPSSTPISITALGSWCIGDDWIADLPVDEAVPMLFRLGADKNEVTSWIGSGRDFREPLCRGSLGVSTDEPWKSLPSGRRVYAFSPKSWTEHSLAALYWEMHAWR